MVRALLVQAAVEAQSCRALAGAGGGSGAYRVDGCWQRQGRCSEDQGSAEASGGK